MAALAVIVTIVGWSLIALQQSTAAVVGAEPRQAAHAHNGHATSDPLGCDITERGPPTVEPGTAIYDAIGLRSRGASRCPNGSTPTTGTTCDDPSTFVMVARATPTTQGQVQVADRQFVVFDRAGVAANAGDNVAGGLARNCLKSFTGDTLVLVADGSKKPIKELEVGDKVIATDPETGQRVARKVTFVWVHDDQVLDLVVDGKTITTTEDHPFWSATDQTFEDADQLGAGELVLGDHGRLLSVAGLRYGTERTAVVYNLSIAGIHTYHVGDDAVLVHNTCGGLLPEAALDATGKVHGPLPRPGDLGQFDPDALVILRGQLAVSVQTRIARTVELGADRGHNARLAQEQQLIHSIEKALGN